MKEHLSQSSMLALVGYLVSKRLVPSCYHWAANLLWCFYSSKYLPFKPLIYEGKKNIKPIGVYTIYAEDKFGGLRSKKASC